MGNSVIGQLEQVNKYNVAGKFGNAVSIGQLKQPNIVNVAGKFGNAVSIGQLEQVNSFNVVGKFGNVVSIGQSEQVNFFNFVYRGNDEKSKSYPLIVNCILSNSFPPPIFLLRLHIR